MDWGFIGWLIVGIIAGWAAGHLTRGRGFGIIGNIVVGVIGAVIGGFIFGLVGLSSTGLIGSPSSLRSLAQLFSCT